ncbi:ABC transporter ATP-binding protein [Patescibacteria group bacterium]|nr:ABC transporter ATP-binding protein [Patescibacteria group bacterium]
MIRNKETIIDLQNVTKVYKLHHEKPTFSDHFLSKTKWESFSALNNINLEIGKGEKMGIIGVNGSGKTTLLKVIAGITTPTRGKVSVKGKVVSLINLGAGFHPDLTGEENLFLNGMLIGMKKDEIKEKYKSILDFAEIEHFIDAPLYTYSDGMKLRLAFSVAIYSEPDILLLDEVIAAGDKYFQEKSFKKLEDMFRQDKTIIVVSHLLQFLKGYCDKVAWIDKGEIKKVDGISLLKEYTKI